VQTYVSKLVPIRENTLLWGVENNISGDLEFNNLLPLLNLPLLLSVSHASLKFKIVATPQHLRWDMESLFTQKLSNQMKMKKKMSHGRRGTFPHSFKKNNVSRSIHLLGLQISQYHLDCAKQIYYCLEPQPP
jgi:hypothetical protein